MATYCAKLDRVDSKNIIDNIVRSGLTSADISVGVKGKSFYVDSVKGSAGNDGLSWDTPLATIDSAIDKCTANKGDAIFVAPYHQEVKAAAGNLFSLDVAGVTIIGVSNGAYNALVATGASTLHNMPTLILDHADATVAISAPNCRISGFLFVTDVADVVSIITPSAASDGLIIDNNVFKDNAANLEYLVAITLLAATPNVQIIGNKFYTTAAGGTNNAILSAANTGLVIKDNFAFGKFATGVVLSSAPLVQAEIIGNTLINAEAAIAIALNGTTSTGILASNFLTGTTSQAAALTGDNAMFCFENYINDTAGSSGLLNPAVDS
jgi:hypothetical protein